ncbi:MAG: NUDIX domain-containing protein, partial [Clostridium sp.]
MIIREDLGLKNIEELNAKLTLREAVRGIILDGRKILLIRTNKGDYKLPGGGIKNNEDKIEALKREVKEETGYKVIKINEACGEVVEQSRDTYDETAYFKMVSYYYLCEVSNVKLDQELDEYEKEQDFIADYVLIDKAIEENENVMLQANDNMNNWVERETM